MRNGPKPMPAKLNIEKARPQERYEIRDEQSSTPQRIGTTRTASEPRGPPARQYTRRSGSRGPARRRPSDEEEDDEYPSELYDMYRNSRGNKSTGRPRMPKYIEEEEEYASDYDDGSFDENDFEMVSRGPPTGPRSRAISTSGGGRGQSRRPDIRKIRVKVHADDVRYIMIGAAVEFPDLVDKIREKFGLRKRFKIKVKDEDVPNGDMITMGDQDDLEMVIMSVKAQAKRERLDMGKMEVSIRAVSKAGYCANSSHRSGYKKFETKSLRPDEVFFRNLNGSTASHILASDHAYISRRDGVHFLYYIMLHYDVCDDLYVWSYLVCREYLQ